MNTRVMRFLLFWHTNKCSPYDPSSPGSPSDRSDDPVLSSLDFTRACLNAELPEGRTIVLHTCYLLLPWDHQA
eukprot:2020491-Amphidinium_carterae.5